jgi:hypothetical protein
VQQQPHVQFALIVHASIQQDNAMVQQAKTALHAIMLDKLVANYVMQVFAGQQEVFAHQQFH